MTTKNDGKIKWFRASSDNVVTTWTSSVEREVFQAEIVFDAETNVYTLTITEDGESDVVTTHESLKIAKRFFRKAVAGL